MFRRPFQVARYRRFQRVLLPLIIFIVGLLLATWILAPNQIAQAAGNPVGQLWNHLWTTTTAAIQPDPLSAAWERVQAAGSYHFSSDVTQTTTPSASVLNAGRRSQTDQIYMEGMADIDATEMEFRLWSGNGSLLQAESSLSARVADGKTYTRQNEGAWVEASDFTQSLAPAGDFMSYLVAARDITELGTETRAGLTFTRYAFTLDGPTFARSVQEQMAAAMRLKGDVPDGIRFEAPSYYSAMTGHGELWVGQDGLPIRQQLALQFPEQNDEAVSAHIIVNFSRFGYARDAMLASAAASMGSGQESNIILSSRIIREFSIASLAFFAKAVNDLSVHGTLVATTLLAVLVMTAIIYYRRTRLLQRAISLAVIGSFLVGPVLSTMRLTRFFDAQTARAAVQETQVAESKTARRLRAAASAPAFDPHQNPLAKEALSQPMAGLAAPINARMSAPARQTTNVITTPNGIDSDGDGLTDFAEQRIGTNPNLADSDGDTIPDKVEVDGFAFGGQTWYGDPNNVDSNNDGAADTLEWDVNGDGQPDDTDGNGVPDLFDNDNDGDGVPDDIDIAPFAKIDSTFTNNTPFRLQLSDDTPRTPIIVDFQLRPTDEDQLWFAANLLDWPQGEQGLAVDWPQDEQGQLQDVDGKAPEMKLVPVLEITIPNAAGDPMLPPDDVLAPYAISATEPDQDGTQRVYVPLTLLTDEKSGARVAFGGRMRYQPFFNWGVGHFVRLAWVVQMENDVPCDPTAPDTTPTNVSDNCNAAGYRLNQPQIIHRYYEDWTLTGLTITEEHGADMALIYQDPALPGTTVDDSPMAALTYVLEQRFLMAGDGAGGTARTMTPATIQAQFDRGDNGGTAPFGVPNVFQVESATYATFDEAVYKNAAEAAPGILANNFATAWAANNNIKPLLMTAYDQKYRSVSLDALHIAPQYAILDGSGNGVTFDLAQDEIPIMSMVGLKWTPYCGARDSTATLQWSACAADAYWLELADRHADQYLDPANPTEEVGAGVLDADTATGQTVVTQLFAAAMMQGANTIIQENVAGLVRIVSDTTGQDSNAELSSNAEAITRTGASMGIKKLANQIFIRIYADQAADAIVQTAQFNFDEVISLGTVAKTLYNFRATPVESGALGIAVVAAVVAISVLIYLAVGENNEGAQLALGVVMVGFSTVFGVIAPIYSAINVVSSGGGTLANVLSNSKYLGLSRTGAAAGAAVAIAVTWGFAIYAIVENKVPAFSPAFNFAIADAIAATIYIILITLLSLTGAGLILVGIVTLIDLILTLVCQFGNARDQDRLTNRNGCISISGTITNAIASLLYAYDIMIDPERADLVAVGVPRLGLADPDQGYAVDASLDVTLPVTTTIVNKKPEPRNRPLILPYLWFFSKDTLRSTTFTYSLTTPISETLSAERGEMRAAWAEPTIDDSFLGKSLYATNNVNNVGLEGAITFDQPGLNRKVDMHLNMAYALPAFECWLMPIPLPPTYVPVCRKDAIKGDATNPLDAFYYDILPNSLAGFMTLSERQTNQFALAWDANFAPLADADGDGLLSTANGGLDTNDRAWDSDNDGLADPFEIAGRAAGLPYNPTQCDTDGDGLTDKQEAQFGSNPGRVDSDNDGLRDNEELWHQVYDTSSCQPTNAWSGGWPVTINDSTPFAVRVSSDPTRADSDGDSLSDLAEKQLWESSDPAQRVDTLNQPWHPTVPNVPPIAIFVDVNDTDRFVTVGQTMLYTTTATTSVALAPSVVDVTAPATVGGPIPPALLPFDPATFTSEQTASSQFAFAVPGVANGQQLDFTSSVRARLAAGNPAPFAWEHTSSVPLTYLGPTDQPVRSMAAVPFTKDRQDSYLMATLTSDSTAPGGNGQLLYDHIPSGSAAVVTNPNLSGAVGMGTTATDIACNDARTCLIVHDSGTANGLFGFVQVIEIDAAGAYVDAVQFNHGPNLQYQPVVASNGTDFAIAYHSTDSIIFETWGNQFTTPSSSYTLSLPPGQSATSVTKDLVWAGDHYRLAYKYDQPGIVGPGHEIGLSDFNADGTLRDSAIPLQNGAPYLAVESPHAGPVLAYDPVHEQTLLLYQSIELTQGVGTARRILIPNDLSSANSALWSERNRILGFYPGSTTPIFGDDFGAAYDQRLDHWLITVNGFAMYFSASIPFFLPLDPAVDLVEIRAGTQVPVACPAPSALPVIDLPFEELPGATAFDGATCSGDACPTVGLSGAVDSNGIAVGTPASDYAVQFDANGDELTLNNPLGNEYTVAFWYKRNANLPQATNDPFFITSNPAGATDRPGMGLNIYAGRIEWYSGINLLGQSTIISAEPQNGTLLQDDWHFVVATRAGTELALYVDGVQVALLNGVQIPTPTMANTIQIGGGTKPIDLDNLQFYNSALRADMVQALYNRTTQSYCVGVSDYWHAWARLNISQPDPRGGKLTASGDLSLIVDRDLPFVGVSGLVDGQFILGNSTHIIGGDATDATSGVRQVEIKVGNGPWTLVDGADSWAYELTVTEGDVNLQLRATDAVGTVGPIVALTLYADTRAPTAAIDALPATAILPTRNAANVWTTRLTGLAIDQNSAGTTIGFPTKVEVLLQGQESAQGNGWQRATQTGGTWRIDYAFADGLADPTGTYTVSVRAEDSVGNRTGDNGATATLRLDAAGPVAALSTGDASRARISDPLPLSGVVSDTGTSGVAGLEAAFVNIAAIAALSTDIRPAQADTQLNRTWLPVTLAQPGAATSTWTLAIPTDLEGEYQIDLRAVDNLGNAQRSDNVWRGIIDTRDPRVVMTATATGATWVDPADNAQRYAIHFVCAVEDRYLDQASFVCPGESLAEKVRSFEINPDLQTLFPDLTLLSGLAISYTRWMTTTTPAATASACDASGRCTTASTPGTVASASVASGQSAQAELVEAIAVKAVAAAAPGAPKAVIVNPTADSFVAASGGLNVTVAAEAGASLKTVTIKLDNAVVETLSFAQNAAIRVVRTVTLPLPADGAHTLVAEATDWANGVQQTLDPVPFTLDTQPPLVTLDTDLLRLADTWAQGSDVLRFHGTASDNVELVAVQIKIGDAAFVDATFGNGTWSTAQYVPDPDGQSLAVTVRAIDRSGQRSDFTGTIGVDLTPTDVTITPPDTIIAPTTVNPGVNSVSVSFAGVAGTNEVATFECRINGGQFQPCESPQQYDGLNNGVNTFAVRAIDTDGIVDPTPASETWTIAVSTLQTTISASPSDPTERRDATFVFSGAASFECALDGAAYTSCTSPQSYIGLRDGEHTFLVRGVNGSTTGAATRFTWTVVNAAPVADDHSVTITDGNAVTIVLVATDADPLTYDVGNAAHGVLSGIPPVLTYTPDTGYAGTDSFTFVANDGLVDSNVATVAITIESSDSSAPNTTITLVPDAPTGLNGWYTSTVTVTVSATDGAGSGVAETRCVLDPATPPLSFAELPAGCAYAGDGAAVATDGQHTTYATSRDVRSNLETPVSLGFQLDLTAPTISASGVPVPNGAGWNNSDVTVSFACDDTVSGVASCTDEQLVTSEGADQIVSGDASDNAGNRATATLTVSLDKTAPTIDATLSQTPNDAGWHNRDVTVQFTCADTLSGVASCAAEQTVTTEGADQPVAGTATDVAENVATTTVNVSLDKTPPVVTCSVDVDRLWPPNHKLATINVSVTVEDALSGPAGFTLVSVVSNEPDSGINAEDVPDDIQGWAIGTADTTGQLRAERDDASDGRVYTLTYEGVDVAGNTAQCSTIVFVPKSNSQPTPPQPTVVVEDSSQMEHRILLPLITR